MATGRFHKNSRFVQYSGEQQSHAQRNIQQPQHGHQHGAFQQHPRWWPYDFQQQFPQYGHFPPSPPPGYVIQPPQHRYYPQPPPTGFIPQPPPIGFVPQPPQLSHFHQLLNVHQPLLHSSNPQQVHDHQVSASSYQQKNVLAENKKNRVLVTQKATDKEDSLSSATHSSASVMKSNDMKAEEQVKLEGNDVPLPTSTALKNGKRKGAFNSTHPSYHLINSDSTTEANESSSDNVNGVDLKCDKCGISSAFSCQCQLAEGKQTNKKCCVKCKTTDPTHFGKAYSKTKLCKKCKDIELSIERDAAVQAAKLRRDNLKQALSSVETFTVDIPHSHIFMVDSEEGLLLFQSHLEHCRLAGIDTETRPEFGKGNPHPTALIQIALRCYNPSISNISQEYVFLIDLFSLSRKQSCHSCLSKVLFSFFSNESILKLGQGLVEDVRGLVRSHAEIFLADLSSYALSAVLELSDVDDLLWKDSGETGRAKVSLQRLTYDHLHMNLLKSRSLTLSNWNNRPLKLSQLNYAICDCLVLLRLYDRMLAAATKISFGDSQPSEDRFKDLTKSFLFNDSKL